MRRRQISWSVSPRESGGGLSRLKKILPVVNWMKVAKMVESGLLLVIAASLFILAPKELEKGNWVVGVSLLASAWVCIWVWKEVYG